MKRLWPVAAVATAFWVSGCGTVKNLTNRDGEGREAFGGLTRDLRSFYNTADALVEKPPDRPWINPGSGPAGAVVLGGLILVVAGVVVGELALSTVADTLTLPILPILDRLDGSSTRPMGEPLSPELSIHEPIPLPQRRDREGPRDDLPPPCPPTEPAAPLTPAPCR
jgi:hypothetical protein